MTEAELAAIESRANTATAGPWVAWQQEPTGSNEWAGKNGIAGLPILTVDRSPVFKDVDGVFIADAREDIPKLVAEVRRLQEDNAVLIAGARKLHQDSGWCPVCEQHSHSNECPARLCPERLFPIAVE